MGADKRQCGLWPERQIKIATCDQALDLINEFQGHNVQEHRLRTALRTALPEEAVV
jgi:hypothetical protein